MSEADIFHSEGRDWCVCPKCGEKIAIVRKSHEKTKALDKVLVIDDEVGILDLLENALGDQFEILRALNAEEGLQVFSKENPKLLIIDIRLPDRNGIELLEQIHAQNKEIPIVMITGFEDERASLNCMQKGASAYLSKPLNLDHIKLLVKNLILS